MSKTMGTDESDSPRCSSQRLPSGTAMRHTGLAPAAAALVLHLLATTALTHAAFGASAEGPPVPRFKPAEAAQLDFSLRTLALEAPATGTRAGHSIGVTGLAGDRSRLFAVPGSTSQDIDKVRLGWSAVPQFVPYLPEYKLNYGLDMINAGDAYKVGYIGRGVTIAVVDIGIHDDHPDLQGAVHPGSRDCYGPWGCGPADHDASWGRGLRGPVVLEEDGSQSQHGTMVAGISVGRPNGYGTLGVAWGAQVLALRVDPPNAPYGEVNFDAVTAATNYAVGKARVINYSLAYESIVPPFQELPEEWRPAIEAQVHAFLNTVHANDGKGTVLVFAAGNGDENRNGRPSPVYPGFLAASPELVWGFLCQALMSAPSPLSAAR